MNRISLILCLAIMLASCASSKNTTGADVENMLNEQRYTFVARTVIPTEDSRYNPRFMFPNGNNLYQLTSGYDLKVTKDSVTAYLPFFGRSFTAPLDPSKGGIKFTSTDFDYKKSMRKKNTEITITPKDVQDIRSVFISVTPGGYAYVQVLSLNKTPISFNGIIEP
ncbi:MAG TPA: DUF4251 domain-containing protein [Niabella sp.]|nr:DUF4251 domain-containing protein [Niabella sp.]